MITINKDDVGGVKEKPLKREDMNINNYS